MPRVLFKLAIAGAMSLPVTGLQFAAPQSVGSQVIVPQLPEANAQACLVSQQTVAAGPVLTPVSERRNVIVEDWRIGFAVPEAYHLSREGLRMHVLPPDAGHFSGHPSAQPSSQSASCDVVRSRGVSISIVNRVVSEAGIRSRLAPGEGSYLGLTNIPSGTAFMHTTRTRGNQVHLSIPFPNQPVSVVFTAHADSNGEIFQEGVFETILETFQFRE